MDAVDCTRVRERIASGVPVDEAPLVAHLQACGACRELAADGAWLGRRLGSGSSREEDLAALFAQTTLQMAAETGIVARLRAWPTGSRALALGTAVLAIVLGVLFATPRPDLAVIPVDRMSVAAGSLLVAILAGLGIGLAPIHRPLRPRRAAWLVGAAILLPIAVTSLAPLHEAHPESVGGVGQDLVRRAIPCLVFGLACAVPVVGAGWLLARRGGARPVLASLLAGAAAVGNLALLFHCPLTAVVHRAAGHASVMLAIAALAALSWPLWTRKRFR